jgi:F420-0:gamma-glutamyl ligase
MQPPQDDLFALLSESLAEVKERDVVLITSKIVSIHQGRCVRVGSRDKKELVLEEAEYVVDFPDSQTQSPLAIVHNALFYAAGIDESNADGHYILLPKKPFDVAEEIWHWIREHKGIENVGVVITDSKSAPLRSGATGVAISWWGFHPTESHKKKLDLFGRELHFSVTNIVDAISAGASAVCGETNESTPIVIVRDVPKLEFTKLDTRHELFTSPKEDIYYPLLKPFYSKQ